MTLLELLRQELPKRGGWPEGAKIARQDKDCEICFEGGEACQSDFHVAELSSDTLKWFGSQRDDRKISDLYVTREQYEATGWDGTGLPPVGVEFEYGTHRTKAKCLGIGHHMIFASVGDPDDEDGNFEEFMISIQDSEFRPLRTEAERAIDEMVQLSGVSTGAAKILYDAGYRK